MTLGFVVGKFYPPHRGHKQLITEARAQVDRLSKETDPEKLRKALDNARNQLGQAPDTMKPALEFVIKRIETRLKQLEAK